jgi:sugar-phosphatase
MASIVVTTTHAHPLDTGVTAVLDYEELRAVCTPDGKLRVDRAAM